MHQLAQRLTVRQVAPIQDHFAFLSLSAQSMAGILKKRNTDRHGSKTPRASANQIRTGSTGSIEFSPRFSNNSFPRVTPLSIRCVSRISRHGLHDWHGWLHQLGCIRKEVQVQWQRGRPLRLALRGTHCTSNRR